MRKITSNSIPFIIKDNFTGIYKNASGFINIPLFNQCMKIISDASRLKELVSENDNKIPPVQTILRLLEEYADEPKELSNYDSICIGELIAFVFKQVLGYKSQKEHVPIKDNFGVKTAAFYYDRQEFEIL